MLKKLLDLFKTDKYTGKSRTDTDIDGDDSTHHHNYMNARTRRHSMHESGSHLEQLIDRQKKK